MSIGEIEVWADAEGCEMGEMMQKLISAHENFKDYIRPDHKDMLFEILSEMTEDLQEQFDMFLDDDGVPYLEAK